MICAVPDDRKRVSTDDEPPYRRYAFLNPYNLSLLVGAGTAAAATGHWWIAVCAAATEGLWMLFGPDSKVLQRTLWEKRWERSKRGDIEDRQNKKFTRLTPEDQARATALRDQRARIQQLAADNPTIAVDLLKDELAKLDGLLEDFLDLAIVCGRCETQLRGFDVVDLQRRWQFYQDQVKHFPKGDKRSDVAAKNLEVLVAGRETRLDAGKVRTSDRSSWFFDSAGWGISARVLRARNEDRALIDEHAPLLKTLYRDHLVYAGALMRVFLESYVVDDTFSAEIEAEGADGQRFVLDGLTDLIVKGTRIYGGAWVFDRTSRHDDGLFEIVPFRGKLDWMSKAIVDLDGNPVTEEMLNTVGVEHSRPFRFSRASIRLAWPAGGAAPAAQIDGEELTVRDQVTIEIVPQAIRLVVP